MQLSLTYFIPLDQGIFPLLRAEVPYFHVVYTLPAPISDIAYTNKAVIYDLLFRASAETTLKIAATRRDLAGPVRDFFEASQQELAKGSNWGVFDPHGRYMVRGQDYSDGWADPSELFRVISPGEWGACKSR